MCSVTTNCSHVVCQWACLCPGCELTGATTFRSAENAVMATGFCGNCSRLLKEFTAHFRNVYREIEQQIREVFRELSQCTCFRTTPERIFLRRMTQEFPSLHLLYGRYILAVLFHCCRQHCCGRRETQLQS